MTMTMTMTMTMKESMDMSMFTFTSSGRDKWEPVEALAAGTICEKPPTMSLLRDPKVRTVVTRTQLHMHTHTHTRTHTDARTLHETASLSKQCGILGYDNARRCSRLRLRTAARSRFDRHMYKERFDHLGHDNARRRSRLRLRAAVERPPTSASDDICTRNDGHLPGRRLPLAEPAFDMPVSILRMGPNVTNNSYCISFIKFIN